VALFQAFHVAPVVGSRRKGAFVTTEEASRSELEDRLFGS